MKESVARIFNEIKMNITDERRQRMLVLQWVHRLLSVIALFMTVMNVFTGKVVLMYATMIFGFLCIINAVICLAGNKGYRVSAMLLAIEVIALFTFFLVSGEPEGFAVNWICLLPVFAFLLYGCKQGALVSGVMLAILVFLLWIPFGRGLLHYEYTESFCLRYPFVYVASFSIAAILGLVIQITQRELKKRNIEYAYLNTHDQLTGLYNRYGMDEMVRKDHEGIMTVFMMDLDWFKKINDSFGHMDGDMLLRQVAIIISKTCEGYGKVARWGGEEFVIISYDERDPAKIAERILANVREAEVDMHDGTSAHLTVSIGIARAKTDEANLGDLLMEADRKLYQAKEKGRDCYVI